MMKFTRNIAMVLAFALILTLLPLGSVLADDTVACEVDLEKFAPEIHKGYDIGDSDIIVSKPAYQENWVIWTAQELTNAEKASLYDVIKAEGGEFNNMPENPDFIFGTSGAQGMTVELTEIGWRVTFTAPRDHSLLWKGTYVCEAPEVTEPVTEPPVTEPPATEPPATEPPATEPPATEPPATEPPATEKPKTEAPKTEKPKTEAPKTEKKPSDNPKTGDAGILLPLLLSGVGVTGVAVLERKRRK